MRGRGACNGDLCRDGVALAECADACRKPGGGGSGLWVVFYMLCYGRGAPLPATDRSLADFQQALLHQYDQQIRLLQKVKYWYLLPPYVGLLLASAGKIMARTAEGQPGWPESIAVAIYTAVFAIVWWLNGTYGVRNLRARRARLLEEMNPSKGQ
jgi:hypothetical protein